MYVIFPAEEVVCINYGYHVKSALPPTSPTLEPFDKNVSLTSVASVPNIRTETTPSRSNSFKVTARRSFSDASRAKLSEVFHSLRPNSTVNADSAHPDEDFFERIKSETRPRLTAEHPKEVKSAPSTPSSSRFFGSLRNNSNSSLLKDRTPIRSILKAKETSPNISSGNPYADTDSRFQLSSLQQPPPEKPVSRKKSLFGGGRGAGMATTNTNEATLRELTHPSFNEHLKAHNSVTFKLVKTVSDFTQQLSQIYEQHAEELQLLVENFRKRNGELRKERSILCRPACPSSLFHTWETLLQEVEIDSQTHSDIASILGRQVARPLLERSFHRKLQSRKVFTHRDSYETIISKTEEKLSKCRQDYKNAYLSYLSGPTPASLSAYFDAHNAYVQQLHATNGMLDEYGKQTLPGLLQELEEIYADLCTSVADAVLQGTEVISQRAMDQSRRYEGLSSQCRAVAGPTDLAHFVRALPVPAHNRPIMRRLFSPPQPPHAPDASPDGAVEGDRQFEQINEQNVPPPLKDELVVDRLASVQIRPSHDALRHEATELDVQIKQTQDSLDTLVRMQQRSLESNLFNKVNELQEDISIKRFDLRVAQIHLAAINSQKELFSSKLDFANDSGRERKMSSSSTNSMKSKWLKAFKSLKTPPSSSNTSPRELEKKNGVASGGRGGNIAGESDVHSFQEYTYKKITPCDICSQVLRGHTRQGLKCRVCKINVHVDCQDKVGRCQAKSRLLRRQKSTSEIDSRVPETTVEEESGDDNYFTFPKINRQMSLKDKHSRLIVPEEIDRGRPVSVPVSSSDGSMRRRLFAGMKSLTGFGSRSRHGSPHSRSISLPEKRGSASGSGTRPFGQPLCLMVPSQENGDDNEVPSKSLTPSPKPQKSPKKTSKSKKAN